ncbi:glycosyltransferase [candidate division WWE3 bacterium]|nr:glycosyltransferase [candidate division WWE3 bacterium]
MSRDTSSLPSKNSPKHLRDLKIALVFDDLIQQGGAEKLLLAVHEMWPKAPVFTSLASKEWQEKCRQKNISLKTSFMQELPFKKQLNRFYSILGLHMVAFESFDLSNYDVILSISSRYAHGIITSPNTKHICYMNSPSRQFWQSREYFSQEGTLIKKLQGLLLPFLNHARLWDYTAAQRVDYFIANSPIPHARIKKLYKTESEIVFPFFDPPMGMDALSNLSASKNKDDYFLVLTRLSAWKRVDVAIKACGALKHSLRIIGEGPAEKKLQKLGSTYENIEFLGYVSEKGKWKLLRNCKALIMTQKEDFGITALEAMYAGKPVIAYKKGGAQSTVLPQKTGEFFSQQTPQSLREVLQKFNPQAYKSQDCKDQANRFTKDKFQESLQEAVNKVYFNLL